MLQKVPQEYVFGRSLFNIYLNNLTDSTEVCNLPVDITFFDCDKDLNSLIKRLEHDSLLAIEWFQNNNANQINNINQKLLGRK